MFEITANKNVGRTKEDLKLAKLQFFTNSGLSNSEILRKVIHISGFIIPLICVQLMNTYLVSVGLFLVIIVYTISELARSHELDFPVFLNVT